MIKVDNTNSGIIKQSINAMLQIRLFVENCVQLDGALSIINQEWKHICQVNEIVEEYDKVIKKDVLLAIKDYDALIDTDLIISEEDSLYAKA